MKIDTIHHIAEDSIANTIKLLESRGFYLLRAGAVSKAPAIHHKTRRAEAKRRAEERWPLAQRIEVRRARERRRQASLRGRWRHLMRTYRKRGLGIMSFEEWTLLWRKAGNITLGDGSELVAWRARGRWYGWVDSTECVQLRRWDLAKDWTLSNTYVQWRGDILADGYEVEQEQLIAEQELNDITSDENNP